jgi:hypothetical protein
MPKAKRNLSQSIAGGRAQRLSAMKMRETSVAPPQAIVRDFGPRRARAERKAKEVQGGDQPVQ